ncbi:hypothetical protein FRB91_002377 [Serendipita sp. 411]|nr:hypothetical protein FRB91_002377 [Serendipita sp. 411]KAG9057400.1 hypothetical protein FS842_006878 [Serendipita sp. 407]
MATTASSVHQETEWYSVYPPPRFDTPRISAEELAEIIKSKVEAVDYIVVDVRRTDFEDTFIRGALNLPAHSFYPTVSTITKLLSRIPLVIFHCNSCKETGRGPRTAGWYRAELERQGVAEAQSKALVLTGGIKEFSAKYESESALVSRL